MRGAGHKSGCGGALFVGQVVNLRPIVNRPAGSNHNAGERPHRLRLAAMYYYPFSSSRPATICHYIGQSSRPVLFALFAATA